MAATDTLPNERKQTTVEREAVLKKEKLTNISPTTPTVQRMNKLRKDDRVRKEIACPCTASPQRWL